MTDFCNLTKDDVYNEKLSHDVDMLISNPSLTLCYKSKNWPDHYKCIMPIVPKTGKAIDQCEKIYNHFKLEKRQWFNCFQDRNKVVLIVQSIE